MTTNNARQLERKRVVRYEANVAVAAAVVLLTVVPTSAQWLKYPTPEIPRTTDGKPDLSAPAPRTADGKPDLSGVWQSDPAGYQLDITADLKPEDVQPWAAALAKERALSFGQDSPTSRCLPSGPIGRWSLGLSKIIQTSSVMAILNDGAGNIARQIFLDGRPLPTDPNPSWSGYSIGRWDGDTLVIESNGFNDKTWLDGAGHPHTEGLRLTERLHRSNFGHMQLQITIDDPKTYSKAWTVPVDVRLAPDTDLLENVCNENERASQHSVAAPRPVRLAPAVLARFAGVYDAGRGREFQITLEGDQLFMKRPGFKVALAIVPVSETTFLQLAGGSEVRFVKDPNGNIAQLLFVNVEGETRALRRTK